METTPEPEGATPRSMPPGAIDGTRSVEAWGDPAAGAEHVAGPVAEHVAGPVAEHVAGPVAGPGPDGQFDDIDEPVPHDPLRFNRWMKRSASGAVLSGIALGLQQALEHKREVPAFVMEAPGEPEDPDALLTLHFDPDDPSKSVAVVRTPRAERQRPPGA